MPYIKKDSIRYFQFSEFDTNQVKHGIFTRKGGVSPQPWKSLNLGGTVGDDQARVMENKKRVLETLNCESDSLFEVQQVHKARVLVAEEPRIRTQELPKADAVITNNPKVTLMMRFADCVPLLFFDPGQEVVGLAHAGWKGTLQKIALKTIQSMVEVYGTKPEEVIAGIGPSIGPDHYQVRGDVIKKVKASFPNASPHLLREEEGTVRLNLWEANRQALRESGVHRIEVAGICTACHVRDWFSHRAEHGTTGRFGALITLF
ncbi:MAG: peptidoglycan editing factor PgeF [Anaerolineales bacterium]